MNKDEVLREFEAAEAILRGHFVLSTGLRSDTYLQCARVLMDARRGERLCAALAAKVRQLVQSPVDIVLSPAMGGVVVGYEMGRQLGVSAVFCERVGGKFELRRGFHIETGQRVLMVEDVVTTGKSSMEAVECARAMGATVVGEACLVDRSNGKHGLTFPLAALMTLEVPTYAPDKLPAHLKDIPAVKPGSRWLKTAE